MKREIVRENVTYLMLYVHILQAPEGKVTIHGRKGAIIPEIIEWPYFINPLFNLTEIYFIIGPFLKLNNYVFYIVI